MAENIETHHQPRMARIRETLVGALGPFDMVADIIVGSQHGPHGSKLFGVVQSPVITDVRSSRSGLSASLTTSSSSPALPSLVDRPRSSAEPSGSQIKTPAKKSNTDKKEYAETSSPSTSSEMNSAIEKKKRAVLKRDEEETRKRRKRKKSDSFSNDNDEKNPCDCQKPCSSGLGNKADSEDNRINMNDLFGDDSKFSQRDNKSIAKASKPRCCEDSKGVKPTEWKKEEGESPDSGFVDESMDSDRERQTQHLEMENVLEELGHISPLLSPVRKPTRLPPLVRNGNQKSLKCELNLSIIEPSERERLLSRLYSLENELIPRPQLSPPPRPSSRYSRSPCVKAGSPYFLENTSSPRNSVREPFDNSLALHQQNRRDVNGQLKRKNGRSPPSLRKEVLKKEPIRSPKNDQMPIGLFEGYDAKEETKYESTSPTPSVSPLPVLNDQMKDQENENTDTARTSPLLLKKNEEGKRKVKKARLVENGRKNGEFSDLKKNRIVKDSEMKNEAGNSECRKANEKLKEEKEQARLNEEVRREERRKEKLKEALKVRDEKERLREEARLREEKEKDRLKEEARLKEEKEKERLKEEARLKEEKEKERLKEEARLKEEKEKERLREEAEKERERLKEEARIREEKERERLREETRLREEKERERLKEEKLREEREKEKMRREKETNERSRLEKEKQREVKALEKEKIRLEKEAKMRQERDVKMVDEKAVTEKDSKRKDKLKPEKKESRDKEKGKPCTSSFKVKETLPSSRDVSLQGKLEEKERGLNNLKGTRKERDGFVCCADKVEKRKRELEFEDDRSLKTANFYEGFSRPKKHKADEEKDKVLKVLYYFDSIVYFILTAASLGVRNRNVESQNRQFSLIRDIAELLKTSTNRFIQSTPDYTPIMLHYIARVKILSWRAQAVLNFQLFSLKRREIHKNVGVLTKFEPQCRELEAVARRSETTPPNSGSQCGHSVNGQSAQSVGSQSVHSAATPSPASSSHSAASEKTKEIQIPLPLNIFKMQRAQLSNLNHLFWAHQTWDDANAIIGNRERDMVEKLDGICGTLSIESSLESLSSHLATGVSWLLAEYKLEIDSSSRA